MPRPRCTVEGCVGNRGRKTGLCLTHYREQVKNRGWCITCKIQRVFILEYCQFCNPNYIKRVEKEAEQITKEYNDWKKLTGQL